MPAPGPPAGEQFGRGVVVVARVTMSIAPP